MQQPWRPETMDRGAPMTINRDYLRERGPANPAGNEFAHMSLITSGMGDVSEDQINTVALHDADASATYTAHEVEELDLSALLVEGETVVAQLKVSAFFGFPSKEDGEDVSGDCVLALTQSSEGDKQRLLFVYTGIVQRSLKGSETYSYVKPCFNCLCIGGETSHTSADYTMSRSSDSGFRIINVADQLVDIYATQSSSMELHKSSNMKRMPSTEECCDCCSQLFKCLSYWCSPGPCLDLCSCKPCCKLCGQTSCCEPDTRNKAFSVDLAEGNVSIEDMIATKAVAEGSFGGSTWEIETTTISLNSVVMHWVVSSLLPHHPLTCFADTRVLCLRTGPAHEPAARDHRARGGEPAPRARPVRLAGQLRPLSERQRVRADRWRGRGFGVHVRIRFGRRCGCWAGRHPWPSEEPGPVTCTYGVEKEILMKVFFAPHGVVGASAWPTGCFASSPSAAAAGVGATEACSALILQRQPAFAFSLRLCVAQCPTGWRRTP